MGKCLVHFFSGTGGTLHAVRIIGEKLQEHGDEVVSQDISRDSMREFSECDLHIFAFPVYGFGVPALVSKYFDKMSNVNGVKTVVLAVCADQEGNALKQSVSKLRKKGFDVFLSDVLCYPSNFTQFSNPPEENDIEKIIMCAEDKIDEVVGKIIEKRVGYKEVGGFESTLYGIVFSLFTNIGRRMMGKFFTADEKCISCGKCEKDCPVGAVRIKEGYPVWGWNCEACQRCINTCPQKSIQTSGLLLILNIVLGIWLIFKTGDLISWIGDNIVNITLLNVILFIVIYFGLSIAFVEILDRISKYLKKIPIVRMLFGLSYTKHYRRYYLKDSD